MRLRDAMAKGFDGLSVCATEYAWQPSPSPWSPSSSPRGAEGGTVGRWSERMLPPSRNGHTGTVRAQCEIWIFDQSLRWRA